MDYVCARESYAQVVDDIKPMLVEHHRELALYQGDIQLDPDFEVYEALDRVGKMAIYTARHEPSAFMLAGYAIYFLRNHHHYRAARWAVSDIVLVGQAHRNIGLGTALFDLVERDLKETFKVDVMHTMTKVEHPELRYLLEARGHAFVEASVSKRL